MEYAGIKFPANLDTPYSVAQVLLQEPGKLRMKDIREGKDIIADAAKFTCSADITDKKWFNFGLVKVQKVFVMFGIAILGIV